MRKNILILGHNDATQFIDIYNQYTRLFDKNKYNVTVAFLTGAPSEETRQRTIAENIVFLNIPKRHIRALKLTAIRRLLALTQENKFDMVICHRYKPTYIMMAVNQLHPIPALICVMHELRTMTSWGRRLILRLLAKRNTLFAGVSNAVRDDLRQSLSFIPQERIITLYNCIDIELTEPHLLSREEARSKLGLPSDAFVFGTIGRLVHNKDQASLIHAFSLIKQSLPINKLIIIGDGALQDQLTQQIQNDKLSNDVSLTGFLPGAYQYMKAFDCFVLPSIQEAFGRVLIEAMIARVPIIASAVNGIPEVMGDTGLLVAPKNPVDLSVAMQTIQQMSIAERNKIGNDAYHHMAAHFSIPAFEQQFWQLPLIQHIAEQPCA